MEQQLALFTARPGLIAVFSDFQERDTYGDNIGWQGGTLDLLSGLGLAMERIEENAYLLNGSVAAALIFHTSFIATASVVVRRSAFDRAGFFDPSYLIGEDLDMWIRLSLAGSIGYVDSRLVMKEKRPASLSHQTARMFEDLTRLYAGLPSRIPDLPEGVKDHIFRFLKREYRGLGWYYRTKGEYQKSRHYYRLSLQQRFTMRTLAGLARTYLEEFVPALSEH